jgi:uncharacterized membrane protein YesL
MRINLNGPILTALSRIFDTILVTLLYLLCCLPVVTIGAATAAMYATMIALLDDGCTGVASHFFGAFRDNFKQSTAMLLPAVLVGLVVMADIVICWGFSMEATMILAVMRGLTVFSTGLYTAMCIYVFAGIAVYRVTWKQAITNALQWTVKKLPGTLGLLLVCIGMALSVALLWYFCFPVIALGLYLQALLLRKIFELESIPEHHEEEIEY